MERKMTASVPWLAFPLAAMVVVGCGGEEAGRVEAAPDESVQNVRVLDLHPTDLEEWFAVSGPLEPVRGTDVFTEEGGVVERLGARRGGVVKAESVVVELDRRMLEAEMKSSEAARILREYNEDRTRTLFEANSVSKQEMLKVHTELEQATQAARIAKLHYERAAIKAPFDGVVSDRFVEVGELVVPGQRIARVVDPFTLKLVGSVTEREIAWFKTGGRAQVSFEGTDAVAEGRVSYIGIEANRINGKFTVEITVPNPDLALRAGVVGRARVVKAVHKDVLAIPRDALVRGAEGLHVFVVEGDSAALRRVTLGPSQGLMVTVTAGLDVGDQLVVRGQRQIQAGGRVEVREQATARDGSRPEDPPEVREAGAATREGFAVDGSQEGL